MQGESFQLGEEHTNLPMSSWDCYDVLKTCIRTSKISANYAMAHIKGFHQTVAPKTESAARDLAAL